MWALEQDDLSPTTLRARLRGGERATGFGELARGLGEDPALRRMIIDHLRACPFEAFRWEPPPVNEDQLGRAFEFVLINTPRSRPARQIPPPSVRSSMEFVGPPLPSTTSAVMPPSWSRCRWARAPPTDISQPSYERPRPSKSMRSSPRWGEPSSTGLHLPPYG